MFSADKPAAVGDEAWAKFDAGLKKKLEGRSSPSEGLHVVVRMKSGASEPDAKPEQKEVQFREKAGSLLQQLERDGATDIQLFWINSTVSAVVRPETLNRIGNRADVTQVILMVRHKAVL